MDHKESSLGDFESTLKKHAQELVESLERGQFGSNLVTLKITRLLPNFN